MPSADALLDHLRVQRDAVIMLQRRLVSAVALGPENGGVGEWEKYEFIRDFLIGMGVTDLHELHAPDPRVPGGLRPNLAAFICPDPSSGQTSDQTSDQTSGQTGTPGKTLWIVSHMDVVPAGDPVQWVSSPFTLKVVEDNLFGRGVEDNHSGLVSSLLLAKALRETGTSPAMRLGLLFVADEETGSKLGLDHVLAHHPDLFSKDDLIVVPDFGSPDSMLVEVAEKSILWLKLVVTGKQCHASTPDEGINSLVAASGLVLALRGLADRFPLEDPLFVPARSTFEPTKKEANVENVNTIPGRDVFYLDCRVLPEYDLAHVISFVRDQADRIEEAYGVKVEVETVQREQAAPATPPDSEVVARLLDAIRAEHGRDPRPAGIGGGTVAAYLRRRGFRTAVWATQTATAHQPNERSTISGIMADARVLARVLMA